MTEAPDTQTVVVEVTVQEQLTLILAEIKKTNKKIKKLKHSIRGLKK